MKTVSNRASHFFPKKKSWRFVIASFSKKQWYIFLGLVGILIISTILILREANNTLLVTIPTYGGTIEEGIIGTPRFINPVLAISDADKDITALVYAGLMKKTSSGNVVPDIAESYEVSPDGLTYTFIIKDHAVFHDDKPITANDVIYTINKIKNPSIKSPKRIAWEGVNVAATNEKTVVFTLKQPFAAFLENASVGIIPAHQWIETTDDEFSFSDYNIKGIGSGPYKISKVIKKSSGVPESIALKSFDDYTLGKPYINSLVFTFYPNERELIKELKNGTVKQVNAISPKDAIELEETKSRVETTSLSRIFGLFFNQNQAPIFTDKNIIRAFDIGIDKNKIINEVLLGYGKIIDSPIPQHMLEKEEVLIASTYNKEGAIELLEKSGWILGQDGTRTKAGKILEFSLATGDTPELKEASELIRQDLENLGVRVEVKVFETGNLNQNVIQPRKYDALFFGQIVNNESDLYAFWHSSQRNDPGLNVASYTNTKVDQLLENALITEDREERIRQYQEFEAEIKKDMPAVFVYTPDFIYIVRDDLKGFDFNRITTPSDRFATIKDWYIDIDRVWKIFDPSNKNY